MKNLGIAQAEVIIHGYLAGIGTNGRKYNFDVGAFNWNMIQSSQLFYPLLTEYVQDSSDSFSACFPSKRKWTIDNFMKDSQTGAKPTSPNITWTPIEQSGSLVGNFKSTATALGNPGANKTKAPTWKNCPIPRDPYPDDVKTINEFYTKIGLPANYSNDFISTLSDKNKFPTINYVNQTKTLDGMWWAIQSSDFLYNNMPFWVSIKRPPSPPSSAKNPTWIVLHFGDSDKLNIFDIWISPNQKPKIVDYLLPGNEKSSSGLQVEFESDVSRIMSHNKDIEIGVIIIAGRLVVYVNGNPFVYTRVNKDSKGEGSLMPCKIASGTISIYGTNIPVTVNVSPMIFAPSAVLTLPLPSFVDVDSPGGVASWAGINAFGEQASSVCELIRTPNLAQQPYGCDCALFTGAGGTTAPRGAFYNSQGTIKFSKSNATSFPNLGNTAFYYLVMESSHINNSKLGKIYYGGCPFFFRLQGYKNVAATVSSGLDADVTNYVISVDENSAAPDYFHAKRSATVTLYNPGGIITTYAGVQGYQQGITISWGWGNDKKKSFTGLITNTTTTNIAGKEIVTLQCEDYMYILNNVFIVNSPFYDGMVASYALKELATRAGILNIVDDWEGEEDYYLPSGYSFSKPAFRFPSTNKIFDCMIKVIKMYQAYMYFDAEGHLHITKLPGGLFSETSGESSAGDFISDPTSGANEARLILGERTIDFNFDSTVNSISLLTVDRNTRNIIIYGKGGGNHIAFNKFALINEPALGELGAAKLWVEELAKRLFYPIIKTRFKTVGSYATIAPLQFITVDASPFRLMSIKRSYNAETNDFTASYEAEWLGGR